MKVAGIHLLKEMLFTAEPVSVIRLEALGVVSHAVAAEELEVFTMNLAAQIAKSLPARLARSQGRDSGSGQCPPLKSRNL
jgi:methylmalonyl-CoA decarboxylase